MKKRFSVFCILLALLLPVQYVLPAADAEETHTLRIVTEQTPVNGMNAVIRILADEFQQEHPDVTIEIEILPTEDPQRRAALDALRERIDAGEGPDLYLLPTRNVLTLDQPRAYTYKRVEMLFPDVEDAMRHGFFYDLSEQYEQDAALKKDGLHPQIMAAGSIGDARFVLPLQYQLNAAYIRPELLDQYSVDGSALQRSFPEWMEAVIASGEQMLACGAEHLDFDLTSQLIDYESSQVTLDVHTLVRLLTDYQQVIELVGDQSDHRSDVRAWLMRNDQLPDYPVWLNTIRSTPVFAAIAKQTGIATEMEPIRTENGDITAAVSFYGAIGSNCREPELAYALLRMFLTERGQYGLYAQYPELLEYGWPVRWKDCVEAVWEKNLNSPNDIGANGITALRGITITAEDIPLLDCSIDIVRFPLDSPNILGLYADALSRCSGEAEILSLAETILADLAKR